MKITSKELKRLREIVKAIENNIPIDLSKADLKLIKESIKKTWHQIR